MKKSSLFLSIILMCATLSACSLEKLTELTQKESSKETSKGSSVVSAVPEKSEQSSENKNISNDEQGLILTNIKLIDPYTETEYQKMLHVEIYDNETDKLVKEFDYNSADKMFVNLPEGYHYAIIYSKDELFYKKTFKFNIKPSLSYELDYLTISKNTPGDFFELYKRELSPDEEPQEKYTYEEYKEKFTELLLEDEKTWFVKDNGTSVKPLEKIIFRDINSDGKPDLILQYSGNDFFDKTSYAYSLKNNKLVRSSSFRNLLDQYYDTKTNELVTIGHYKKYNDPKYTEPVEFDSASWDGTLIDGVYYDYKLKFEGTDVYTDYYLGKEVSDGKCVYYRLEGKNVDTELKKTEISQEEYYHEMIVESKDKEPVHFYSETIDPNEYSSLSKSAKKTVLSRSMDSYKSYLCSDQIQYINGKHYYTGLQKVNTANVSFDFLDLFPNDDFFHSPKKTDKTLPYVALDTGRNLSGRITEYDSVTVDNFIIVGKKIYFTSEYPKLGPITTSNLYVCDEDGQNLKLIKEDVFYNIIYSDNKLYYKTASETTNNGFAPGKNDKTYCYDTETERIEESSKDFDFNFFSKISTFKNHAARLFYDGGMYFHSVNPQGTSSNMYTERTDENNETHIISSWYSMQM